MFSSVIRAVLLWLIIFIFGTFAGIIVAYSMRSYVFSAVVTQLFFIAGSLLVAGFLFRGREPSILGFRAASPFYVFASLVFSTVYAFLVACVALRLPQASEFKTPLPGARQDTVVHLTLALFLAPLGEETVFRGFLLGYMLESRVSSRVAVLMSALLFTMIHVIPFFQAPLVHKILVLSNAFIMSVAAGYLRTQTRSVLPAIAVHMGFNLGGLLAT